MKTSELNTMTEALVTNTQDLAGSIDRVRSALATLATISDTTRGADILSATGVEDTRSLKSFGLSGAAAGRRLRDSLLNTAVKKHTARKRNVTQKRKRLKSYYRGVLDRSPSDIVPILSRGSLIRKLSSGPGDCLELDISEHMPSASLPLSLLGEDSYLSKGEISPEDLRTSTKHAQRLAKRYITNMFSTESIWRIKISWS